MSSIPSVTNIRSTKAQALLETAIILPVLLMLFLGIFEIGAMLVVQQAITHAVNEGARVGSLTNSNEQIESAIANATSFVDKNHDKVLVTIDPADSSFRNRGDQLHIEASYEYPFSFLSFIVESKHLTAEAITRIEATE